MVWDIGDRQRYHSHRRFPGRRSGPWSYLGSVLPNWHVRYLADFETFPFEGNWSIAVPSSLGSFVALARAAGPASGGLCLFAAGVYGGQYAVKFPISSQEIAGWICVGLMIAGGMGAAVNIFRVAFGPKTQLQHTRAVPSNQASTT